MSDILATLFRFRQFVFEYGPLFLATWFGLAVTTGLIEVLQSPAIDLKSPSSSFLKYWPLRWMGQLMFSLLWHPGGKIPPLSVFSGRLLFSIVASVPALVVTSLIGMEIVWLRLILTALFALSLSWFVTAVILRKPGNFGEQRPETETAPPSSVLNSETPPLKPREPRSLAQVTWKNFIGQVEETVIPLIIGFSLASILTIYVPAYTVRPWLGEGAWQGPYLAALLGMPFQLTGGAEVLLASALLVKGASLGTALSLMLVAPTTTFYMLRHLCRPLKVKAIALYLIATWFVAGSLGVAVDGIQRLLSG